MKKQILTALAATAVVGVTTAFAANPFSDVTPNDWAYQAVEQLANDGIINGYPNGTFQGQKDITRYEVAQMTAKAMAYQGRVNAEQQALINRLADEYSSELNNLGVRVSNLEDRVGNVKVTGDFRARYQGSENYRQGYNSENGSKSVFDFRGRIQFNANVNKDTQAVVRVTSGNREFGGSEDTNSNDDGAYIDRAYIAHQFSPAVTGVLGRTGVKVGQGLVHDGAFDGAAAVIGNKNVKFTAGYGFLKSGNIANAADDTYNLRRNRISGDNSDKTSYSDPSMTLLQLDTKLGNHVGVGGFYAKLNHNKKTLNDFYKSAYDILPDDEQPNFNFKDIYGYNANFNWGRWNLGGEFTRSNVADSNAWVAGLGYGNYDITKPNTWSLTAQYFNLDKNAFVADSTWDQGWNSNYKGWVAEANYALAKNIGLTALYSFNNKYTDKAIADNEHDSSRGDYYMAKLDVVF